MSSAETGWIADLTRTTSTSPEPAAGAAARIGAIRPARPSARNARAAKREMRVELGLRDILGGSIARGAAYHVPGRSNRPALRSPHSPNPSLPEGERGTRRNILFAVLPHLPFGRGGPGR